MTCEELPPLLGNRWRRAPLRLARSHFAELARWHCWAVAGAFGFFGRRRSKVPLLRTYSTSETPPWLRPSPSLPAVRGRAAAAIQGWRKNVLSISALVCSSTMAVDLAMNKYGGGGGGVVVRLKTNKKKVVNKGSDGTYPAKPSWSCSALSEGR